MKKKVLNLWERDCSCTPVGCFPLSRKLNRPILKWEGSNRYSRISKSLLPMDICKQFCQVFSFSFLDEQSEKQQCWRGGKGKQAHFNSLIFTKIGRDFLEKFSEFFRNSFCVSCIGIYTSWACFWKPLFEAFWYGLTSSLLMHRNYLCLQWKLKTAKSQSCCYINKKWRKKKG